MTATRRNARNGGLFVLALLGLCAPALALDSLDRWAGKLWTRPLPPPADSVSVVLTQEGPGQFKRSSAKTTVRTNADGSYSLDYAGPDETSHGEFRWNGALVASTADNVKDKKVYHITLGVDRKQATFRTEEKGKGKEPSTKTLALKPNNLVMSEYVNLIRQAWPAGLRGSFGFKGVSPDGGLEIDMETTLVETDTPWNLGEGYEVPPEFQRAFPPTRRYVVADFQLGGMFSMLYRFHNYWIFQVGPTGLEPFGSYGGDPKKATFTYVTANKE